MAVWPATLPDEFLVSGFQHSAAANRVSFSPEKGPPIVRRRGTSAPQRFSGSISPLTTEQWETFQDFYRDDLKDGASRFTWRHPITLEPAVVMFDPEAGEPQTSAYGAGLFMVSMTLLVLH